MNKVIQYGSYNIHCQIEGQGEKILFLHGWPGNSLLWKHQLAAFKDDKQTIAIDWLGFGESDKPLDHVYSFSSQKEQLDVVLADLLQEGEQISLVAHDIGGPPSILWASENPTRVKRLIVLNTVFYSMSTMLDKMSHTLFRIPVLKQVIATGFGLKILMRSLTRSGNKNIGPDIREILAADKDGRTTALKMKTILEPVELGLQNELMDLAEKFEQLSCDRHLIMAKSDPLCFAHISKLSKNNPNVPAHTVEKCGHLIPIDQPQVVNQLLKEIFEE